MTLGLVFCRGCMFSGHPHNEDCPEASHNKYRDPNAPTAEDVQRLMEWVNQRLCKHLHTRGGNDYLSCNDCGVEWDYRKQGELERVLEKSGKQALAPWRKP